MLGASGGCGGGGGRRGVVVVGGGGGGVVGDGVFCCSSVNWLIVVRVCSFCLLRGTIVNTR